MQASRHGHGPRGKFWPIVTSVALGLAAIAAILFAMAAPLSRQQDEARAVDHSLTVLDRVARIDAELRTLTVNGRDLMITRDPGFAVAMETDAAQVVESLARLSTLTADSPVQRKLAESLRSLVTTRIAALRATIEKSLAREQGGLPSKWGTGPGALLMREITDILATLKLEERHALAGAQQDTAAISRHLAWLMTGGGAMAAGSLCCALLMVLLRERSLDRQRLGEAQRQAEAAEREAAFFRNSGDVLSVVRVEPRGDSTAFIYEALSPGFERVTGLSAAAIIGRNAEACLPPGLAAKVTARFRDCLAAGDTITYTACYDLPIGARDVEASLTPVRQPGTGRIVRLVGAIRDITERNRIEAALRQTHRLEALGRLASGISHDFNNTLQAIIGGLELVLDELAPGSTTHEFASLSLDAAQLGADLTRHLLAYAGHQVLVPRAIDPVSFLADLRKLLVRAVDPRVRIELRVDPATPGVFADAGQLQTALLNLTLNAAHAMPRGGTVILAAHVVEGAPAGGVAIRVSDTGMGMDGPTLAHATDPFFTTKGLSGTGLGLAMVKAFAEQSGGSLRITSRVGAGTTVTLVLPIAVRPAETAAPRELPASVGRILLVDDAPDVLTTTGAFLGKAGFAVVSATSGNQALTLIAMGERFDALVTDLAMPGMSGLDLIAEARMIQALLPALIVTGFAESTVAAALPERAMVLRKPATRADMIEMLGRLIGATSAPARHVATAADP